MILTKVFKTIETLEREIRPPIDLLELVSQLEVDIEFDSDTIYQGYFSSNENKIYLGNGQPIYEERFTLAHEIAEVLMYKLTEVGGSESRSHERLCDKIARELTIPLKDVKKRVNSFSFPIISKLEKLSKLYEIPKSQIVLKLVEDIPLWKASFISTTTIYKDRVWGDSEVSRKLYEIDIFARFKRNNKEFFEKVKNHKFLIPTLDYKYWKEVERGKDLRRNYLFYKTIADQHMLDGSSCFLIKNARELPFGAQLILDNYL